MQACPCFDLISDVLTTKLQSSKGFDLLAWSQSCLDPLFDGDLKFSSDFNTIHKRTKLLLHLFDKADYSSKACQLVVYFAELVFHLMNVDTDCDFFVRCLFAVAVETLTLMRNKFERKQSWKGLLSHRVEQFGSLLDLHNTHTLNTDGCPINLIDTFAQIVLQEELISKDAFFNSNKVSAEAKSSWKYIETEIKYSKLPMMKTYEEYEEWLIKATLTIKTAEKSQVLDGGAKLKLRPFIPFKMSLADYSQWLITKIKQKPYEDKDAAYSRLIEMTDSEGISLQLYDDSNLTFDRWQIAFTEHPKKYRPNFEVSVIDQYLKSREVTLRYPARQKRVFELQHKDPGLRRHYANSNLLNDFFDPDSPLETRTEGGPTSFTLVSGYLFYEEQKMFSMYPMNCYSMNEELIVIYQQHLDRFVYATSSTNATFDEEYEVLNRYPLNCVYIQNPVHLPVLKIERLTTYVFWSYTKAALS
jgi:hypothetical protein